MELFDIVFYVLAIIIILSAFIVVFSRNMVYAAFSLLFTFFGVAAFYVMLHADFLAVAQILIYVGGILVLLLFGVMLTNRVVNVDMKTGALNTVPALVVASIVAGTLSGLFYSAWSDQPESTSAVQATTKTIGEMLMTTYLLPFELASVILIVALIGAAWTARRTRKS